MLIILVNGLFFLIANNMGDTLVTLPTIDDCVLEEQHLLSSIQIEDASSSFTFSNCFLLFSVSILFSLSIFIVKTCLINEISNSYPTVDDVSPFLNILSNKTDSGEFTCGSLPSGFNNLVFEVSAFTGEIDFSKPAILPTNIGESITVWDPATRLVVDIICNERPTVIEPKMNYPSLDDLVGQIALDDLNREALIEFLTQMYS